MSSKQLPNGKGVIAKPKAPFKYLPPEALLVAPLNPRVHSRQQIKGIARSIDAFGFLAPIVVDKTNHIVAGHGRYEAAKHLGLKEVPIIRADHLTEEQAKAYRLADNKLTDRSTWDDQHVATVLKELSSLALEFDIEATGFDMPEIDLRIQSLDQSGDADADDEFGMEKGRPVTRPGDVWQLGDHRLLCGSALDAQAYQALLGAERAAAIFTDAPYNLRIKGLVSGKGRKTHREFAMASGEMTEAEFTAFLENAFRQMMAYATDSAIAYACMDWRHMAELHAAIRALECELVNVCVWSKTNAGMGALYRSAYELVFVFRRKGEKHLNNVQLGKYGRYRTNVWTYPGMNSFARTGQKRDLDDHPTVKPISMVADAILDVTERGSIVLDPFCGSGTTILAAERTGRRGYGIEIDPIYVDTTVMRWQRMTGRPAMQSDGKTFDEIRREGEGQDRAE